MIYEHTLSGSEMEMVKDRIKHATENISKYVRYFTGSYGVEFSPGTQTERTKSRKKILVITLTILAVILLLIIAVPWIRYYDSILPLVDEKETWLGFIASFWGAIVGAIIAGIGTIITTWMVIRRSYRIDFHRERMENLPVLEVTVRKDLIRELQKTKNRGSFLNSKNIWHAEHVDAGDNNAVFQITNVGAGMAVKIEMVSAAKAAGLPTPEFVHISKGESSLFLETYNRNFATRFELSFFDIFENMYSQEFIFQFEDQKGLYLSKIKMPELIRRTARLRYIQ